MQFYERKKSHISPLAFCIVLVISVYLFSIPSIVVILSEIKFHLINFSTFFAGLLLIALMAAIPLTTLWFVQRRGIVWPFYLLLLLFFFGRIAWYLFLTPEPVSDFGAYWRLANEYATGARPLPLASIYHCRAVPYLVPVISVFGVSLFWLAVVNSAAIAVISLVSYRLTARIFSPAVAAACVVFANMAPEVFGASAIPSHDVSGLFFFSLLLVPLDTAVSIMRRQRGSGIASIAALAVLVLICALLVFVIDLQRFPATTIFLVLASWLVLLAIQYIQTRNEAGSIGGRALTATGVFVALVFALTAAISSSTSWFRTNCFTYDHELQNFIAYAHSFSDGAYRDWFQVVTPMFRGVGTEEREDILKTLVLSDIADSPVRRWEGIKAKSARLFSLGNARGFYTSQWGAESLPVKVYVVTTRAYLTLILAMFALSPVFLVVLYRRGLVHFDPVAYVPFLLISVLVFFLILASQIQSRYIFPIYFYGAIAYGAFFAYVEMILRGKRPARPTGTPAMPKLAAIVAALIAAPVGLYLIAGYAIDQTFSYRQGRLIDLEEAAAGGTATPYPRVSQIPRELTERRAFRAVLPVFGSYESWIWADQPGSQRADYRFCELPRNSVFELKGLAGVRQLDARPGTVPPAATCSVRAGEVEHDCLSGGQFTLAPVSSDEAGCVRFSQELVSEDAAAASWLTFVRAVQLSAPSAD